jgi:hypothetical protein
MPALFHTGGSHTRAAPHHPSRGRSQTSAQVPLVFSFFIIQSRATLGSVAVRKIYFCIFKFLHIQLSSIDVIEGFVDTRTEGSVSCDFAKRKKACGG